MNELIVDIQQVVEDNIKKLDVYLSSELTVSKKLTEFKNSLVNFVSNNDEINIFSQKDTEIDICMLQILIAAKKLSQLENKKLFLNFHISQTSKNLITTADLDKVFKNYEL